MKFIQALALVAFSAASVGAKSFLGPVDNEIRMFTTHTVEWLTDREEVRLLLTVGNRGLDPFAHEYSYTASFPGAGEEDGLRMGEGQDDLRQRDQRPTRRQFLLGCLQPG